MAVGHRKFGFVLARKRPECTFESTPKPPPGTTFSQGKLAWPRGTDVAGKPKAAGSPEVMVHDFRIAQ